MSLRSAGGTGHGAVDGDAHAPRRHRRPPITTHLLFALGALGLAALALRFLPAPFGAGVTGLLVGATTYVALVTLVNRTTIRATRESLEVRHGPMPIFGGDAMDAFGFWPDVHDVQVPAPRLLRIARGEREIVDLSSSSVDSTRTKVYLKAVFHDGADAAEAQLPSTAPEDVEDFIGWGPLRGDEAGRGDPVPSPLV